MEALNEVTEVGRSISQTSARIKTHHKRQRPPSGPVVEAASRAGAFREQLLTAQQVADRLGIAHSTAYQWSSEMRLPTVKFGRSVRFRESEVEKFILNNERPALCSSLSGGS